MPIQVIDSNRSVNFEFDHVSNTFVDEMELVREQPHRPHVQCQGQQTCVPITSEIEQVVQHSNHPQAKRGREASTGDASGSRGKERSTLVGGKKPPRKRARTEYQQPIKGLGKRTSPVWAEFTVVEKKDEEGKVISLHAVCRHCKATSYRAEGRYGTSNCISHLKVCEPYLEWEDKYGNSAARFDQDEYCRLFANAIMLHNYPLSIVEHEGMRKLHAYLNPNVKHISRATITRWCMKKYGKMKKLLFESLSSLSSKVSLTCDIWTACTTRSYLTLTAHFIDDDWCLKSKVLNFRHFPPPHTGFEISKSVYGMIKEWGLEKKIMCITIDNASNMDNMVGRLQSTLNSHSPFPLDGKYFHIRCSAHILNLIVTKGLKEIDPSVKLVRENVKYIDGSESRMNRFRECALDLDKTSSLKLLLDVPTRWNSTYLMLSRGLHYQSALKLFADTEDDYPFSLTSDEWNSVRKMSALLQPFYEITNLFSGSDYPTANLYLEQVCKIQHHLQKACQSEDVHISEVGYLMFEKFKKYWDEKSVLLSIVSVLDPRYKFKFLRYHFNKVYESQTKVSEQLDKVHCELIRLFNHYKGPTEPNVQNTSSSASITAERNEFDDYESFDYNSEFTSTFAEKTELDIYLDMPLLNPSGPNFDILLYWKAQQTNFPVLYRIAKDILAIPITSVASESTFSMGGRIFNRWRAALLSMHVEALVTTRNWLFGYEKPDEDDVNVDKDLVGESVAHEGGGPYVATSSL